MDFKLQCIRHGFKNLFGRSYLYNACAFLISFVILCLQFQCTYTLNSEGINSSFS